MPCLLKEVFNVAEYYTNFKNNYMSYASMKSKAI